MYLLCIGIVAMLILIWTFNKGEYHAYIFVHESNLDSEFKNITEHILSKNHWNAPLTIVNKKTDANIIIKLMPPEILNTFNPHKRYYPDGRQIHFSYTFHTIQTASVVSIYINLQNWYGVAESGLSVNKYREYVINHELGHALGHGHLECDNTTSVNGICPVMYQSTAGCPIGYACGYKPNIHEL